MRFNVRYRLRNGRVVEEKLDAESGEACERRIADKGALVIDVSPLEEKGSSRGRRGRIDDIAEFTSIMAALLGSSLPVREALTIVRGIADRPGVEKLATRLSERLDKGQEFSVAVESEGEALPPIYLGLVRIGERTGDLSKAFNRLSSYIEDSKRMREAISGALVYPCMVFSLLIVGGIGISVYALPKITSIFAALGGGATESVMGAMHRASAIFGGLVTVVSILAALIIGAGIARAAHAGFKKRVDAALLRLPVLGKFLTDSSTLDFSFAMEALVGAGVPLDAALGEASRTISNAAYAKAVLESRDAVRLGRSISQAFGSGGVIPRHVIQWLAVGERTGRVAEVFGNIRGFYQRMVNQWSTKFVSLVEPAVSVLVGIIIIMIVVLFVLPLFTAYGSVL